MRKSAEEILKGVMATDHPEWVESNPHLQPGIHQAMQTFAKQQAVEFEEWKDRECRESPYVANKYEYKGGLYTNVELYQIFTDKQKEG